MINDDVAGIRETLDARQTVLSKKIVTDAALSGARIFQTPREVSRTGMYCTTPWERNIVVAAARFTSPLQFFHSTTDSPSQNRNQDIINPIGAVSPQWTRNANKLKTSVNWFFVEDRGLKTILSKVLGCKFTDNSSVDIKSRCGTNFGSNAVFTQNLKSIHLGLASVNTTDKLGYVTVPTTRIRRPTSSSD